HRDAVDEREVVASAGFEVEFARPAVEGEGVVAGSGVDVNVVTTRIVEADRIVARTGGDAQPAGQVDVDEVQLVVTPTERRVERGDARDDHPVRRAVGRRRAVESTDLEGSRLRPEDDGKRVARGVAP